MASSSNNKTHELSPVSILLKSCIVKSNQNLIFQYSKYINGTPGSGITKYRKTTQVSDISSFAKNIDKELKKLKIDEEIAFHSAVVKNNIQYQIPLIDFANPSEEQLFTLMSNLQEKYNCDIYLFKSGRSYHAYFDTLLSSSEWTKFLGELLLLNRTSQITDTLWIGHSLINGFSSLRLSCNTILYLSYPIFWQKLPRHNAEISEVVGLFERTPSKIKFPALKNIIPGISILAKVSKFFHFSYKGKAINYRKRLL